MGDSRAPHDPERGGYRFGGWQLETRRSADRLAATFLSPLVGRRTVQNIPAPPLLHSPARQPRPTSGRSTVPVPRAVQRAPDLLRCGPPDSRVRVRSSAKGRFWSKAAVHTPNSIPECLSFGIRLGGAYRHGSCSKLLPPVAYLSYENSIVLNPTAPNDVVVVASRRQSLWRSRV